MESIRKKKRLLFAACDIGWRIEHYTKFIKKEYSTDLIAEAFVNYQAPHDLYKTEYTYSFNYSKMPSLVRWGISIVLFFRFLCKYDIFHFFSGETILTRNTRNWEFKIYKLFKKRIIMHFVGADIRNPEYVEWKEENIVDYLKGNKPHMQPLGWQQKLMKDTQKFADQVLVSTPDLLKVYPGPAKYFPVLLDIDKLEKELSEIQTKPFNQITIVHAPSNPKVKGSRLIEPALKKIKGKYGGQVRLVLKEDLESVTRYSASRYDLFKYFLSSHIVVDQLVVGWYGLQAIEALMMDNQVVSYIEEGLEEYLFPDCPIMSANALNLFDVIDSCVKRELEGPIDHSGAKRWVKKYHSIESNNEALLNSWGVSK